MKYDDNLRLEVLDYLRQGVKVKTLNEKYGITISTLYKWRLIYLPNYIDSYNKKLEELEYLIANKRVEEAVFYIDKNFYKSDTLIQEKKVKILIQMGKLEEALAIALNEIYENNDVMQSQIIRIYALKGDFKRAMDMANDKRFLGNPLIEKQKQEIVKLIDRNDLEKKVYSEEEILKLIHNGKGSLEIINNSSLDKRLKNILKLAFYDKSKYPQKVVLRELKTIIEENIDDVYYLAIINKIKPRLTSKVTIFDYLFYKEILKDLKKEIERMDRGRILKK